jgi:hypothetical protein
MCSYGGTSGWERKDVSNTLCTLCSDSEEEDSNDILFFLFL